MGDRSKNSCMYQCSPGGHHMDRGGCFYNGCPSPGSSQAGEICFGAAGDPFGHDMLEFGSSGASACLEYIHRSESTSYHTRSSAMREFFDRSSMSNSTAVALRGDVEKSGFFNFLWRAYTVYRGVLNAACGVIEEGADLICGCSLCDFI